MKQFRLLLLLALLMTAATGAWGMQIYISYPSWPTGTNNVNGDGNLVLEMEPYFISSIFQFFNLT